MSETVTMVLTNQFARQNLDNIYINIKIHRSKVHLDLCQTTVIVGMRVNICISDSTKQANILLPKKDAHNQKHGDVGEYALTTETGLLAPKWARNHIFQRAPTSKSQVNGLPFHCLEFSPFTNLTRIDYKSEKYPLAPHFPFPRKVHKKIVLFSPPYFSYTLPIQRSYPMELIY